MKFEVGGMTCGHCVKAVREAITAIDPRAAVDVDLASGAVDVVSLRPRDEIASAIRDAGYTTA